MAVMFDTNILIDYENGNREAARCLSGAIDGIISRITWMEVLAGIDQTNFEDHHKTMSTLSMFDVIEVDETICRLAAQIHFERIKAKKAGDLAGKIRHSDCIIHATAMLLQATLITRNTKDFKPVALLDNLNISVIAPYDV